MLLNNCKTKHTACKRSSSSSSSSSLSSSSSSSSPSPSSFIYSLKIGLLDIEKSWYYAQPRPINNVNYFCCVQTSTSKTSNTEGGYSPQPLSYPRDIRLALDLAVQLSHHFLSFGSELRPYQTETHHVLSKTERLSWKRAVSRPTEDQQKPQLRLREICFPQGHPRKRVRQRQHYLYQSLCGKRWNEWALISFYSVTLAQGRLGLFE